MANMFSNIPAFGCKMNNTFVRINKSNNRTHPHGFGALKGTGNENIMSPGLNYNQRF